MIIVLQSFYSKKIVITLISCRYCCSMGQVLLLVQLLYILYAYRCTIYTSCGVLQMAHIERVLGVVLIHCTGTTAGFLESLKDKVQAFIYS